MILLIVLALGLGGGTVVYFFRESFLAELAISFLPYMMVGLWMMAVVMLGILIGYLRRRKKQAPHQNLKALFLVLLFLRSTGLGILYGSEFFSFYSLHDKRRINQAGLKVYYANILFTNNDYESLKKQIDEHGYDIVVLVEFSDKHEKAMKEWFQERFPYVNRNSWSTKLAGDVVFSKYPITNLTHNASKEQGRRRYSYFSVEKGVPFYFYVVHTSAPVSPSTFRMRNEQLKRLKADFLKHEQERGENAPVILVGDFNLSPWSAFYAQFIEKLDGKLKNEFRDYKPHFTRSLWDQKILNVHIDQLFVSPDVKVGDFWVADLPGSDHHAFSFDVESEKY